MRKSVYALWWATVLVLALALVKVFIIFYYNSGKSAFNLITLSLIVFLLVHTLITSQAELRYCRKQPLCNIAAAGLLERYTKFLNERDFDKSYNALVKACETAPDETFLWCTLASFCEFIRNNATESDKYMAKAEELILTKKANSNSDKACYFNFLGGILYGRGEYEKGLEYMKQSIDIEPNPRRVKTYEEKLSEFKAKQQNTQL
jgi:Tfp pilus assembly protein PilF